jgi:alpha-L-rhamnosidase
MTRVGSPFAMLYLYEALEKYGHQDHIIESIYRNYLPMLKAGATTVWECFPGGTAVSGVGNFPSRSHCHGWSAAAAYFLNRIVLGIKQTDEACKAFEISPRLNGIKWAKGSIATIKGPINVSWEIQNKTLIVNCSLPKGVKARFVRNDTHKGLRASFKIQNSF